MKKIIGTFIFIFTLSGCQVAKITKKEAFPKMYSKGPTSILVLPAINKTTAADAAELYATTIAIPLSEAGYYVFSIPFVEKFLQREGVVDGEQVSGIPLTKFKDTFGADTVLFVTINGWDTNYFVTGGNVTVAAKFVLKSTTTGEVLWQYDGVVVHNTSGNSGNIIADLIATAITTSIVDYVPIAEVVNRQIINSMPVGKYNPRHGQDGQDAGVIASKVKN